ncbi:leucine-rich repeat domain-containing protein [Prevotella veroralis]|uniref:leucine-rich repeat domain-containing protein n=2 Tax=Prevotella veroralis TaxID=28137 RepID=UPI00068898C7|nr:leucine-rich repeat domain-containing protein [Prevotella veroralis]
MRVKLKYFRLFAIAFLMLLLPKQMAAYTDGDIVKHDGIIYQVVKASESTLSFVGTEQTKTGAVTIPDKWSDNKGVTFRVTKVGGNETYTCTGVTDITLPEGIKTIDYASFSGAELNTLKIPASVTSISHNTFYRVRKMPKIKVDTGNTLFTDDGHGALYSKDMTELYAVPTDADNAQGGTYTVDPRVKKIYHTAFLNYSQTNGIKKIILPPHLQEIETDFPSFSQINTLEAYVMPSNADAGPYKVDNGVLFKNNTLVQYPRNKQDKDYTVPSWATDIAKRAIDAAKKIESINLNNVTQVNENSIFGCEQLKTVTLPKDLKKEGAIGAIANCPKISEYRTASGCVNFIEEDGVIYSNPDKSTLYFFPPAKPVPNGKFTIPSSVKTIEAYAFMGNKNIREVMIPKTVTAIKKQAFSTFTQLEKVTFESPSSCSTIDAGAFGWNGKLKEITLPAALTELDKVFIDDEGLETINVPDNSKLKTIKSGALQLTKNLKHFNFLGSCDLEVIEDGAFQNLNNLEGINFPKNVTTIGSNAFNGCRNMTTAKFDDNAKVEIIKTGAFADCGLTSISIPNSVKKLESEAFRKCAALTTVNLSKNVEEISSQAFKYCEKLTAINVNKENTRYSSVDGYLLSHDKTELILFPHGKASEHFNLLPPSITKIGDYAFYECTALKNVVIPNKVTEIGERAFSLCKNLNTIAFLCDAMINPTKINQAENKRSFDNGTAGTTNMPQNIDIYVRQNLLNAYKSNSFYSGFKSINPSFIKDDLEYLPVSDNAVDLLEVKNTDYTFVVPEKVEYKGKSYNVNMIGDYAFQKTASDVHEVIVKKNVEYIGAKAFKTNIDANTSTIENVFFLASEPTNKMLSTTRFELDETETNYNEFAPSTNIYVKKSQLEKYKTAWDKKVYDKTTHGYVESHMNFISQIDYKIPDVKILHKYGTFAREFDTDFSQYYKEKGACDMGAFVAPISNITQGSGDYGAGKYMIRMTSTDENGGVTGNHGYVPAGVGVLLKVLDGEKTSDDFFYTIGEEDNKTYTIVGNMMTGITVNPKKITKGSEPIYVVSASKGIFMKAPVTLDMPIHKAYARIPDVPAGAKVMFIFSDDNSSATRIDTIGATSTTNDINGRYYNLQGQRVEHPKYGIYIHNGKKVIIK